jgi:hypothetical protein
MIKGITPEEGQIWESRAGRFYTIVSIPKYGNTMIIECDNGYHFNIHKNGCINRRYDSINDLVKLVKEAPIKEIDRIILLLTKILDKLEQKENDNA